jgi:hypothetical protein
MPGYSAVHPVTLTGSITSGGEPVDGSVAVSVGELAQAGGLVLVPQPDTVPLTAGLFSAVVPGCPTAPAPLVELAVTPGWANEPVVFQLRVVTAGTETTWEASI